MVVGVTLQWVLFLPIAYLVGPHLGFGLLGIWVVQVGHRAIQAGCFAGMWNRGNWTNVKL
jgi:Na+-driven multidrug efflux pump